jgi:ubiquinone biosynthesis protein COQ9
VEEFLSKYAALSLALIALGTTVYKWFSADGDAAMAALKAHKLEAQTAADKAEKEALALERRLQRLEDKFEFLPSKDDFHTLATEVAEMRSELKTNTRAVESMDRYWREKSL